MNDSALIITVCNRSPVEEYYCLREFVKSTSGHDMKVLGTGAGEYRGLASKPKLLHRAISESQIKYKYIIFCDSWDLVFACHPQELFETYLSFASPIVVSCEKNCFPTDYKEQYDALPYTSSYKYLNSGMIVGETEAIFEALESMNLRKVPDDHYDAEKGRMVHPNDQQLWQEVFLKQPVNIELDYQQILCNTLHDVELDDLDFSMDRIRNRETKTYPCSFHFNGGAKTGECRNPVLEHLKMINF